MDKVREELRKARGRKPGRVITEQLTPLPRGWISYFKLSRVKGIVEDSTAGCAANCAASSGGNGNAPSPVPET